MMEQLGLVYESAAKYSLAEAWSQPTRWTAERIDPLPPVSRVLTTLGGWKLAASMNFRCDFDGLRRNLG